MTDVDIKGVLVVIVLEKNKKIIKGMSQVYTSHVKCMDESCHIYKCIMSHTQDLGITGVIEIIDCRLFINGIWGGGYD